MVLPVGTAKEASLHMKVILLSVLFVAAPVFADPLEFPAGIDALKTYAETLKGERRKGAEFLLKHLPASDRESLSLPLFQENLEEAFVAREGYLWTKALPQDLFFNEVLPHAVVTETRDGWRKMLRGMFDPMLEECETIEDVCRVVGSQVKERTGVKYSTKREKACQSPAESIRQGKASCTGLSILMVDALRAAGVPARLVAIPLWGTKEGNHTWVEVHDGKAWRFTGYGGMPARWDQGWEIARCAYCDPMEPIHGVFASSYRMTPVGFPTIWEWGRLGPGAYCRQERDEGGVLTRVEWSLQKIALGGVDRTTHYIALAGGRKLPIPKGKSCVAVRATLSGSVTRVDLPVRVFRGEQRVFEGSDRLRGARPERLRKDHLRTRGPATGVPLGRWKLGSPDRESPGQQGGGGQDRGDGDRGGRDSLPRAAQGLGDVVSEWRSGVASHGLAGLVRCLGGRPGPKGVVVTLPRRATPRSSQQGTGTGATAFFQGDGGH